MAYEVIRRVNLNAEPGSVVILSDKQREAVRQYVREIEGGSADNAPPAARRFDFSADDYRAMLGKLTVEEIKKMAVNAGITVDAAAKKADIAEALIKRIAP